MTALSVAAVGVSLGFGNKLASWISLGGVVLGVTGMFLSSVFLS